MNYWLWGGIAAAVGAYGVIIGGVYTGQRRLLYFPDSECPSPRKSGVAEMAEVSLETDDGLSLVAWYHPPAGAAGVVEPANLHAEIR